MKTMHFARVFFGILMLLSLAAPPLARSLASVNLNTATEQELETLPGVGPTLAKEIVASRPFKSVDDLRNVKGIGDAKFGKLQGLVTVGAPAARTGSTSPTTSHLKPGEKININSASLEDLDRLPGIGPAKAKAIMEGRPYKTVDDLLKVKGIKQATLDKIKDHVTVD